MDKIFINLLETLSISDSIQVNDYSTELYGDSPQDALTQVANLFQTMTLNSMKTNTIISALQDLAEDVVHHFDSTDDGHLFMPIEAERAIIRGLIHCGVNIPSGGTASSPKTVTDDIVIGQVGGKSWSLPVTVSVSGTSEVTFRLHDMRIFGIDFAMWTNTQSDYAEIFSYTGRLSPICYHADEVCNIDDLFVHIADTWQGNQSLINAAEAYQTFGTLDSATLASIFRRNEVNGPYTLSLTNTFTQGVKELSRDGFLSVLSKVLEEEKDLQLHGNDYEFHDEYSVITSMVSVVGTLLVKIVTVILQTVFYLIGGIWSLIANIILAAISVIGTFISEHEDQITEINTDDITVVGTILAPFASVRYIPSAGVPAAVQRFVTHFGLACFSCCSLLMYIWQNEDGYSCQFLPRMVSLDCPASILDSLYLTIQMREGSTQNVNITMDADSNDTATWGSVINRFLTQLQIGNLGTLTGASHPFKTCWRSIALASALAYGMTHWDQYVVFSSKTYYMAIPRSLSEIMAQDDPWCALVTSIPEMFHFTQLTASGSVLIDDRCDYVLTGWSQDSSFRNAKDIQHVIQISGLQEYLAHDQGNWMLESKSKFVHLFKPAYRCHCGVLDFRGRYILPDVASNSAANAIIAGVLVGAAVAGIALAVKTTVGVVASSLHSKRSLQYEQARSTVMNASKPTLKQRWTLYRSQRRLAKANRLAATVGVSTAVVSMPNGSDVNSSSLLDDPDLVAAGLAVGSSLLQDPGQSPSELLASILQEEEEVQEPTIGQILSAITGMVPQPAATEVEN